MGANKSRDVGIPQTKLQASLAKKHAPKYPAILVSEKDKEACMISSVPSVQNATPFDYSVYSNPEFDGLPVLGPYRYMQTSKTPKTAEPTVKFTYKGQYKDGL